MFKGDSKTFKYIASKDPPGDDSRTPQHRARVRVVNAGDKAISPAKSKPKKRNKLHLEDGGLTMECVEWSSETYSVEEMVQQFGSKFPVLVKTVQGYDKGGPDLEVATGQILQLHSYGEQERMKARMTKGSMLSIPLCYPMGVKILEGGGQQETVRFEEAVRKYTLPIRVLVLNIDESAPIGMVNITGQELVILEAYDELYIKCNNIQEGWIEQNQVIVIPAFVDVKFSVAISMHGATTAEWEDYYKMFAFSVRHLNYKMVRGYEGVVFCDGSSPRMVSHEEINLQMPSSNNMRTYANIPASPRAQRQNNGQLVQNNGQLVQNNGQLVQNNGQLVQNNGQVSPSNGHVTYENIFKAPYSPKIPPKMRDIPPKLPSPRPHRSNGVNKQPEALHQKTQYENIMTSQNHAYITDDSDDDVTNIFDDVIRAQEMKENKTTVMDLVTRIQLSPSVDRRLNNMNNKVQGRFAQRNPPKAVVHPSVHGNQSSSGPFITSVQLEPLPPQHRLERSRSGPGYVQGSNHSPFARSGSAREVPSGEYDNNHINKKHNSPTKETPFQRSKSQPGPLHSSSTAGPGSSGSYSSSTIEHNPNVRYQTLDTVPKEIETLNVEEICHCLKLLNMVKHVKDFSHRQVDGAKLRELKEVELVRKFNFSPFDASKLQRFVRGWRPQAS